MNKHSIYVGLLALILSVVLITAFTSKSPEVFPGHQSPIHSCYDGTHQTCDGYCVCDGMECPYETTECPNAQAAMRDYQIEVLNNTIIVYDGRRLIGSLKFNTSIGKMILRDNQ